LKKNKNLFHVNLNNYSNNSPCYRYFLDNYCRLLNGKEHSNDGGGDCQYNNGNDQDNDNDSNNDGKTNLKSLLNCAIKIYNNPIYQRDLIRKDNNGNIGVYAWINIINGKFYIGSGDPLYVRLSDYYKNWYLNSRSSLYIVRALSKYGMSNFTLAILDFTDEISVISREQKYINRFKPEYNLNPLAGNSKGYKQTPESIEKKQTNKQTFARSFHLLVISQMQQRQEKKNKKQPLL